MNKSSHDEVLLREFVESRSEDAFRQLVERYTGLVFGVALRCTGSRELSEEISQNVFTIFAAKAARLSAQDSLAPWLHRTAFFEATKLRRAESRRMTRMNKLIQDSTAGEDPPDPWEKSVPCSMKPLNA